MSAGASPVAASTGNRACRASWHWQLISPAHSRFLDRRRASSASPPPWSRIWDQASSPIWRPCLASPISGPTATSSRGPPCTSRTCFKIWQPGTDRASPVSGSRPGDAPARPLARARHAPLQPPGQSVADVISCCPPATCSQCAPAAYLARRTGTGSHYETCRHRGTGLNGRCACLPCARQDRAQIPAPAPICAHDNGHRGGENRRRGELPGSAGRSRDATAKSQRPDCTSLCSSRRLQSSISFGSRWTATIPV